MAETRETGAPGDGAGPVDRELNFRGILLFVAGLSVVILVVFGVTWGLGKFFTNALAKKDPAPAALVEAREARVPPAPNLEPDPAADLTALRAAEEIELAKWAWADRDKAFARVPIDRALEIVATRGLPPPPPMPPPEPAAKAAP